MNLTHSISDEEYVGLKPDLNLDITVSEEDPSFEVPFGQLNIPSKPKNSYSHPSVNMIGIFFGMSR